MQKHITQTHVIEQRESETPRLFSHSLRHTAHINMIRKKEYTSFDSNNTSICAQISCPIFLYTPTNKHTNTHVPTLPSI